MRYFRPECVAKKKKRKKRSFVLLRCAFFFLLWQNYLQSVKLFQLFHTVLTSKRAEFPAGGTLLGTFRLKFSIVYILDGFFFVSVNIFLESKNAPNRSRRILKDADFSADATLLYLNFFFLKILTVFTKTHQGGVVMKWEFSRWPEPYCDLVT